MIIGSRWNYSSLRKIRYLNRTAAAEFEGDSLNTSMQLFYNYYGNNNEFSEQGSQSADLTLFSSLS
ncbi:MAG: hypothetical protein LBS81_05035 [Endomicrobium sp.]|jgi:hypothetical protein|nr:hypothetical protein [Endomicrobium sp.]